MFDKNKFATIIKNINELYENQTRFANASGVNRTNLSQYMNLKLDSPPSPKVIKGIATASKGITSYDELMEVCGYVSSNEIIEITNPQLNTNDDNFFTIPVFISNNGKLEKTDEDIMLPFKWDYIHNYFGYRINDDSMLPLVGIGDLAIIEEINSYSNGQTCLISIDDKTIFIRKIIDFKEYIELHTAIPYSQPIKLTDEEKQKRNFKILGKVIKVENSSAFK